jgi:hypothetical protein
MRISRGRCPAGEPDLDVVGLGGGEPEVSRAEGADAVMDVEFLEDVLSVEQEAFQLVEGVVGVGELDELHLVELVLACEPPGVLPVGPRFLAETGGVRDILDGEFLFLEYLVGVDVGHGYLGGGYEEVVNPSGERALPRIWQLPVPS